MLLVDQVREVILQVVLLQRAVVLRADRQAQEVALRAALLLVAVLVLPVLRQVTVALTEVENSIVKLI